MYDNFDQIIALYEVINIHNCVCVIILSIVLLDSRISNNCLSDKIFHLPKD